MYQGSKEWLEVMDAGTEQPSTDWIEELTDQQCMEIFWLYVDPPEPFLEAHPPELLGKAMRYALREVAGLRVKR